MKLKNIFFITFFSLHALENNNTALSSLEFGDITVKLWESQSQNIQYLIAGQVVKYLPVHHVWNLIDIFDKKHDQYGEEIYFGRHNFLMGLYYWWMRERTKIHFEWYSSSGAYQVFFNNALNHIITLYERKGYNGIKRAQCVVRNLSSDSEKIFLKVWQPLAEKIKMSFDIDEDIKQLYVSDCLLLGILSFKNGKSSAIPKSQTILSVEGSIKDNNELIVYNWPINHSQINLHLKIEVLIRALKRMEALKGI
jgi:hypothetical protein